MEAGNRDKELWGLRCRFLGTTSALPCPGLTSIQFFTAAGPEIATHVSASDDKLTLSCNMSSPHPSISGHKWMHGGKVLEEDKTETAFTSYT